MIFGARDGRWIEDFFLVLLGERSTVRGLSGGE